ncbi:MAG: DUF512 domain-containing protein [Christensenellaceae bacterium]|jgi:putative radical SAM enzyme (TIGR03279 family)|nr:DUF512 domain-containing protein [Christensenellaceae bacterium]
MPKVLYVDPKGLAARSGIKAGYEIIAFNDHKFIDVLDYVYADGQDEVILTFKVDSSSETRKIKIHKRRIESTLGMEFGEEIEIKPRVCRNDCVFCFVHQLPCGMRDSLYVKDDDYRLSFISGSYITCTNLSESDIQRIIDYKLSPLYVSVHATNHDVRLKLLGIKRALDIMQLLMRLTSAGIKINAQVVLVAGMNDGAILVDTLTQLHALGENILSVSVVPVGLTQHRPNLDVIKPLNKAQAQEAISIVERFYEDHPFFVYCSDEMYQLAEQSVKDYDYYGSFDQIENGVGLIAKLLYEIKEACIDLDSSLKGRIAIITGVSGAPVMKQATQIISSHATNLKFDIFTIKNKFFGESVTVSGLVTASDIIAQTSDIDFANFDLVLIPAVMLKEFEPVFLDDITLNDVEKTLKHDIIAVQNDGEAFIDALQSNLMEKIIR